MININKTPHGNDQMVDLQSLLTGNSTFLARPLRRYERLAFLQNEVNIFFTENDPK